MANKSVYQDFDADALKYFGLESDTIYGVLSTSVQVNKVLCTQNAEAYEKIQSILTVPTEDVTTFINKKKAFILPKCNVSQDRLKAALKENNIIVINDYKKADLIIGHEGIFKCTLENGDNIPSTLMMNKLWNYETAKCVSTDTDFKKIAIYNSGLSVLVTKYLTQGFSYYSLNIDDSLYNTYMLTGMAINLAYIIDSKSVSVIDPETVLQGSANKITLDDQLVEDLIEQVNSNKDDKALAIKVIPTINYNNKHHLIWKLSRECGDILHGKRLDKDLKYWINESRFRLFMRKSAEEMILWLERNDKLCKESFKYLEPIAREEILIYNRRFYTFKVCIKKEYQNYLK
tara:strand:+ start:212 stop:1249 length:1038 start_codon:yes stop_codon:yes gene_type:complete